jgi:hypothetical protein
MLLEPLIQQLHQLRLTPLRQSDRRYALLADPSFVDAGILPPKGARIVAGMASYDHSLSMGNGT